MSIIKTNSNMGFRPKQSNENFIEGYTEELEVLEKQDATYMGTETSTEINRSFAARKGFAKNGKMVYYVQCFVKENGARSLLEEYGPFLYEDDGEVAARIAAISSQVLWSINSSI